MEEDKKLATLTSEQKSDVLLFKRIFPKSRFFIPTGAGMIDGDQSFCWADELMIVGIGPKKVQKPSKYKGKAVIGGYCLLRIKEFLSEMAYAECQEGGPLFIHLFSGLVVSISPIVLDENDTPKLERGKDPWKDDEEEQKAYDEDEYGGNEEDANEDR